MGVKVFHASIMSLVRFPVSSRSSLLGISSALLPANLVHSHLTRKQSIFKAKNIFPRGKQRPTVCLSKRAGESDEVDNSYQLQSRINNTETDYDAPGFEDGSRDCEDWLGVDALDAEHEHDDHEPDVYSSHKQDVSSGGAPFASEASKTGSPGSGSDAVLDQHSYGRAYLISDLFKKAAIVDVAAVLAREHPELAVYGLQSSPDKMEGGEIYCCMPSFLLEVPQLIERAVQAGAHALLIPDQAIEVEGVKEAIPETVPALFVPVVDHMAQQLAAAFYDDPSADLMVVAVSGSHGKTTVSWLIRGVLEEMQQVTGMISSLEYAVADTRLDKDGEEWVPEEEDPAEGRESSTPFHVTPYAGRYAVPSTTPSGLHLQKMMASMRDRGATCAVVECTASEVHRGSCECVHISVAVHTELEFSDMLAEDGEVIVSKKGLMKAALEPFRKLVDPDKQAAVVNLDDSSASHVLKAAAAVRCVTYSRTKLEADVVLEKHKQNIWESEMIIRTPFGRIEIIMPMLGQHNASNILAAVATGVALKVPLQQIVAGIEAVEVVPGRCEVVDEGQKFSVIVDSADTPQALECMLQSLKTVDGVRDILTVFGCRGNENPSMRSAMAAAAHQHSSLVIITNDSPRTEPPEDIVKDIVAGFPDDMINLFAGHVYFPFQDQAHAPLWFEPYLQHAQRFTRRHIMEDRFSAIRAAIGTAQPNDIVLIAGRGHKDCMEYGDEEGEIVGGWFDDRVEARAALSKLTYLDQITTLDRRQLPWGKALDEMDTIVDPYPKRKPTNRRK